MMTFLFIALVLVVASALFAVPYVAMLVVPTPWAVILVLMSITFWASFAYVAALPLPQDVGPGLELASIGVFVGMLVRAFGPARRSGNDYRVGALGIGIIGAFVAILVVAESYPMWD